MDDETLLAIVAVCLKRKEKKKRRKRVWVKDWQERNEFTYQNLLEELIVSPKNDFRHFLINDGSIYEELLRIIGPLIKKRDTIMRDAIPVGLRLTTTLRFLATGDHFENMKLSCGMSPNTISKIVFETCEAINSRLESYMKLPMAEEGWKDVTSDFYKKWKFPNCLGVVTGKHIAIMKPPGTQSLYYNYKKFFSVVLLAVVNANYEFILADVDISACISGSEDFSHTSFGRKVSQSSLNLKNSYVLSGERILPHVFVGDDAFQLTERFMKPFKSDFLTNDQRIYNYRLGRVQQIVENTIGTLTSLFGVLQKPFNLSPEKVKMIVLSCCYLYNFLRRKTEHHLWDEMFDRENSEDGVIIKGLWRELPEMTSLQSPISKNFSSKAEKVRDNIMDFFNNEGKISYQYRMA